MVHLHNSQIERILLVRPSALGDVCRTVPVLVSLKKACPQAQIDWLVQDSFTDAVRAHPDLHQIVPFPRRRFSRVGRSISVTSEWIRFTRSLKSACYDVVYDCQGLARSGLMTWFSRAPRRVGFADAREAGFLGYTHRYRVRSQLHTVDRMLDLIRQDGMAPVRDLRLYTPPDAAAWWREYNALTLDTAADQPHHHYAVLAPTSRWPSKRWPVDRFERLIDSLIDRGFTRVVLVGARSEQDQVGPLIARAENDDRVIQLIGATTIGGLMAVIEHASLIIANDSAALHMAVGFNRPYLGLFGPTDVDLVGPYGGRAWVIQPPMSSQYKRISHKDPEIGSSIMEKIAVSDVLARLDTLMASQVRHESAGDGRLSPTSTA